MYFMSFKSAIDKAERMVSDFKPFIYKEININIDRIYKFVQREKLNNPELRDFDIYNLLNTYNSRLKTVSFYNEHTLNQVTAYNACLYLLKNPKKYVEITEYIEANNLSSDRNFFVHTNSFDENLKNLMLFMRHLYPQVETEIRKNYGPLFDNILSLDKSKQEKYSMAEKMLTRVPIIQRKRYLDAFELLLDGMPAYMKTYLAYTEASIREDLIQSNTELVDLFDTMGYLDEWIATANNQFDEIGLSGLKQDKNAIKTGLSPAVQKTLSTVDLLGINIMYTNRALHILNSYSRAMFAISEFNLEPLLISASEAPQLEKEALQKILTKMELFYYPTEIYYTENESKIEELTRSGELIIDDDNSDRRYYSMKPLETELRKSYGKEYTSYFSKLLQGSKNDVGEDMVKYSQFANAIHRLKSSKNRIALSLYSFLELSDNQKRNYGIVVDSFSKDGTFGELKHFVDFAVDINSMFPVNVHLPQNIFADFAKEYFKTPIVPIYAGSDDWNVADGKRVKSHVMVPWNKKTRKTIKQLSKSNNAYSQKIVDHFRFLSDENCVPIHFKKTPKDKQIHKKYINLDTNSILERTKEGIFIKVLPQGQGDDERFDR